MSKKELNVFEENLQTEILQVWPPMSLLMSILPGNDVSPRCFLLYTNGWLSGEKKKEEGVD